MKDVIIIGTGNDAAELEELYKILEEKYRETSRVPPPLEKKFSELLEEISAASNSFTDFNLSTVKVSRNDKNSVNPNERNYKNKRKW